MKSWPWTRVLLIVAVCAVVAGVVTLSVVSMSTQTVSFGWFAYAPLSHTAFGAGSGYFVSWAEMIGYLVLAVGLIGLAFWAGIRVGSRRDR